MLREVIGVLREERGAAQTTPVNETVAEAVESGAWLRHGGDADRVGGRATGAGDDGPGGPPRRTGSPDERGQTRTRGGSRRARRPGRAHTVTTTVHNARPTGSSPGLASGRAGLVGLDERVRLTGGTLSHAPSADGGFVVVARLPLTGTPAAPLMPIPSISKREFEEAMRRVRGGLRQAVWHRWPWVRFSPS